MRRIVPVAILLTLLAAVIVSAETPPELFQRAKSQIQGRQFEAALATLAILDAETSRSGMESERAKVEPSLFFLRGVCEASLDRGEQARADFRKLLALSPRASIDPSVYSKKVVAAFEEARRSSGAPSPSSGPVFSLPEAYARFHPDRAAPGASASSEAWADGPVRFLMTPEERAAWSGAADAVSRSEIVTQFWAARDPTPETAENEFRAEFERRVAFADATLVQGETRGSLTDRGMVFVLLGPPTWMGRSGLAQADDGSDVRANSASKRLDTQSNYLETWHYRRDRLPARVPYPQVDFVFLTRPGYGLNVLQRDAAEALATLDAAKGRKRSS
jgi:GWxTD domain-containing protein